PPEATESRLAATTSRDQAAAEQARIDADLARERARHAEMSVPAWLDQAIGRELTEVPARLGAFTKAAADRPQLAGQLAAVEQAAERWRALAGRAAQLHDERAALDERSRELAAELTRLRAEGELPSAAELAAARASRDELWRQLRAAGLSAADWTRIAREFE